MEQALPVEYVPFDETVELTGDVSEMSVEQYLSWVRTQANRLPSVFRADHVPSSSAPSAVQTKYMPDIEAIPSCLESLLPSEDWERNVLFTFSELRLSLAAKSATTVQSRVVTVPPMKDRAAWIAFCLNVDLYPSKNVLLQDEIISRAFNEEDTDISVKKRKRALAENLGIEMDIADDEIEEVLPVAQNHDDEDADHDAEESAVYEEEESSPAATSQYDRGVKPTLPLLLQLDQVLTQRILLILIDYVEENDLSSSTSEWIYALLTRVEKPLHRDVVASLRQLFRRCCKLRAQLVVDEGNPAFDESLASLNLIIAITGNYFGQNESIKEYFVEQAAQHSNTSDVETNLMDDDDEEEDGEVDEGDELAGYDDNGNRLTKFGRLG